MEGQTRFMDVNGLRFNVLDVGKGEPIVLLHGFPDSHKVWRKVIPHLLDAGHRVITYDQRGFGETDAPEGVANYKTAEIVKDFAAMMAALGVQEKVKLVGHDWGSAVGWGIATMLPQMVSSYVGMSTGHPTSYYTEGGFEQQQKMWYALCFLHEGFSETLFSQNDWAALRLFCQYHPELDEHWLPDMRRPGRFTAGLNWYRANIGPRDPNAPPLPPVQVPCLGIFSDGDWYLSEAQMANSKNHVAGKWEYACIKDCGHWMQLDQPKAVADTILNFYKAL